MKESWKQPVPPSHVAMFDVDEGRCYSCVFQIEPLRMCYWAEHGGMKTVYLRCPNWKKREQRKEE